jgi:hypothetical protein
MKIMKRASVMLLFLLLATHAFAQRVPLTVNASEGPSQVLLDGRVLGIANPQYKGQVPPGTYELLVRKPGRPEFRQRITVGPSGLTVNARLGASPPAVVTPSHPLVINGNVSGAEVFINNSMTGTIPFRTNLNQGQYNVRIVAPGYQEYHTSVNLSGSQTITVNLVPLYATINVTIPSRLLYSAIGNPLSRIELFIDGSKMNGLSAQIQPGNRQIRVVSGGMVFETTLNARPGASYTVEPVLTFEIRE